MSGGKLAEHPVSRCRVERTAAGSTAEHLPLPSIVAGLERPVAPPTGQRIAHCTPRDAAPRSGGRRAPWHAPGGPGRVVDKTEGGGRRDEVAPLDVPTLPQGRPARASG